MPSLPLTEEQKAMAEEWTGLPTHIASRRAAPGADIDDLVHAGYMGLVRAAQLFDPSLGIQFQTYAYRWVLGKIIRAETNAAVSRIREGAVESIDDFSSFLGAESGIDLEVIRNAVEALPVRLRDLVVFRMWEGDTIRAVATRLGVSKSRAHQLETEAFLILRTSLAEFSDTVS